MKQGCDASESSMSTLMCSRNWKFEPGTKNNITPTCVTTIYPWKRLDTRKMGENERHQYNILKDFLSKFNVSKIPPGCDYKHILTFWILKHSITHNCWQKHTNTSWHTYTNPWLISQRSYKMSNKSNYDVNIINLRHFTNLLMISHKSMALSWKYRSLSSDRGENAS